MKIKVCDDSNIITSGRGREKFAETQNPVEGGCQFMAQCDCWKDLNGSQRFRSLELDREESQRKSESEDGEEEKETLQRKRKRARNEWVVFYSSSLPVNVQSVLNCVD